ncbi:MAG: polysaccharide deacetylase family protein [Chloroflexota bacterium]|nr:polysaccharide deacetylase family protein [Chloroflexota bacterium]
MIILYAILFAMSERSYRLPGLIIALITAGLIASCQTVPVFVTEVPRAATTDMPTENARPMPATANAPAPVASTAPPIAADTPLVPARPEISQTATRQTIPPTDTPIPTETPAPPLMPTPDGFRRQVTLPILMYHYVSDPPAGADRYRRDLSVSPAQFEQQLAFLKSKGYQSINLYDLFDHLTRGQSLPEKPVILTFDDGYLDNYQNVFPLLQEHGFSGTFFVITELAARASRSMIAANGFDYAAGYMNWQQLGEMAEAGMDVECHARVHENLTKNDDDRLVWQVLGCREMIEEALGRRPRFIAYPEGAYNRRVIDLFASDAFWGGITTQQGNLHTSDSPFEITRLRMRNSTGLDSFARLLLGELED